MPPLLPSPSRRHLTQAGLFCIFLLTILSCTKYPPSTIKPTLSSLSSLFSGSISLTPNTITTETYNAIIAGCTYFRNDALPPSAFGELARRTRTLTTYLQQADALTTHNLLSPRDSSLLRSHIETALAAQYPFIQTPGGPDSIPSPFPFRRIQTLHKPGTHGIVIVAGKTHFRFALHLIANIRNVLHSTLPIQIAHAGDADMPSAYRQAIARLGPDIETLDVLAHIRDEERHLDLARGGWALKPFAVLASRFEQVIMLDADAVFLQAPEVLLEDKRYQEKGVLFFHDRIIGNSIEQGTRRWYGEQIANAFREPFDYLTGESVKGRGGSTEECDSGVVVVDKGQEGVLMGLLHVGWQNSRVVREEWTYRLNYGDKESWWFGMELVGVPYAFEEHYAAVLGVDGLDRAGREGVCGFSIAHVDESGERLLWLNGSLLKNKATNTTDMVEPRGLKWMVDSEWVKGTWRDDPSCMIHGRGRRLDREAVLMLEKSIKEARRMDRDYAHLIGDLNDCNKLSYGCGG